ncbi:MAG: hypothetical protein HY735_26035 [Verrucomicrobia bacterium]|nr:hypothetical protein [Verrucomicrobiota bacterium]
MARSLIVVPLFALITALIHYQGTAAFVGAAPAPTTSDSLQVGFLHPPKEARPSVYYLLLNGYLNADHMERELEAFREKGISGLCVFDMGARGTPDTVPPAGPPFLSDAWLNNFARVLKKAGELDLDVQVSVSSSWDMGADWVQPHQASMGLYHFSITRDGPAELDEVLPFPAIPKEAPRDARGNPLFAKEVAVLAFRAVTNKAPAVEKGAVSSGSRSASLRPGELLEAAKAPGRRPALRLGDRHSISNLTSRLESDGRLKWSIPEGRWTIMRYVCANTGERLKVPSPASDGLATDHFNATATRDYIRHVLDRLQTRLGELRNTALRQLYLASYEVRGAIWTPEFLRRFQEYRGYDMTPFLPALSDYVVEDEDTTQRFLYDYGKTLGDLVVDAYYRATVETAKQAGLGVEAEAGGPGPPTHQVPVDALKALGAIDEMRGEFWPWRMDRPGLWVVKETASAAHIYGRKRVHMEAFTSFRHWQDGPFDLKPSADRAFCEGMNHVVWHTSSHQPPEAGRPGWVYGAGTHLTPNVVWWPMAKPFLDYLARCSFLLQQGLFVADVCYYYGDQGFNFVPPKHVDPSLGLGYDYDVTNAEVLLQRMQVENGRIILPDGMRYELLVLPESEELDLAVLERVADLVRAGATVAGPKPARATGLADQPRRDEAVRRLASELWGACDGIKVREHGYGRGRVIWGKPLRQALRDQGVGPDFTMDTEENNSEVDFIHRRSAETEIYFISNRGTREVTGMATFRVSGKLPEFWFPDTGRVEPVWAWEQSNQGARLALRLGVAESVFVVFRKTAARPRFQAVDPQLSIRQVSDAGVTLVARANGSYSLKTNDGRTTVCDVSDLPEPLRLEGPWTVSFSPGWGAPAQVKWSALKSWTEDDDPAIRHFSGIARYESEFDLPSHRGIEANEFSLDLGDLWAAGEVFFNGKSAGIVWKPPYELDVTPLVRPGRNRLQIDIANNWVNRLVGDSRLSKEKRFTRTNITGSGTPRKRWDEIEPRASGLFGPVTIRAGVTKKVPFLE